MTEQEIYDKIKELESKFEFTSETSGMSLMIIHYEINPLYRRLGQLRKEELGRVIKEDKCVDGNESKRKGNTFHPLKFK